MSHYSNDEKLSTPRNFISPDWKSIVPDTIMDVLFKILCR
jgi:hypothetical protein